MEKWALVVQGGGTRAAYAGGALEVLLKAKLFADLAIGTSAGALLSADYVSRDEGRNKKILEVVMGDLRFASLSHYFSKKASFFDFDYLFKDIPTKIPFNLPEFLNSSTDYYCCTTSLMTGQPFYFNRKDPHFFLGLAASCSMPLYNRKPVMVDGKPYLDGGVVARIPYKKALEEGYEKIVVIATRSRDFSYPNNGKESEAELAIVKTLYKKYPLFLEANRNSKKSFNEDMEEIHRLEKEGRLFVLYPSVEPSLGHATRSAQKIEKLYEEGEQEMKKALPALIKYLG